jgi:hypothetical protein
MEWWKNFWGEVESAWNRLDGFLGKKYFEPRPESEQKPGLLTPIITAFGSANDVVKFLKYALYASIAGAVAIGGIWLWKVTNKKG